MNETLDQIVNEPEKEKKDVTVKIDFPVDVSSKAETPKVEPKEEPKTETPAEMVKANPYTVNANEIKTDFFDPVVWTQMKGMAATFVKSGALPESDNTETVIMKLQAGREMGMTPIESIKSFYFVKGSINIFGAAVMRRLREHGWSISYKDETNKCTVTVKKGDVTYSDSLTFEDAEKSGWTMDKYKNLKPGWLDGVNRRLKLRYGATSMLIKTYIPEVLGNAVDIAEVAMDAMPVYEAYEVGNKDKKVPNIEDGDSEATKQQIDTIKAMGGDVSNTYTKQQAADYIAELAKQPKEEPKNGTKK